VLAIRAGGQEAQTIAASAEDTAGCTRSRIYKLAGAPFWFPLQCNGCTRYMQAISIVPGRPGTFAGEVIMPHVGCSQ
jgi:hypothetical protein